MPNFIDHRISTRVSTEFRRTNVGRTRIVALDNGNEHRNAQWLHHKLRFAANYAMLTLDSQRDIETAFYAARAQLYLFRFKDWGDYIAESEPLAPIEGTVTPVQLVKSYAFGPATFVRRIQAIVSAVVKDETGSVVAGTLDTALGLFTPASAWGAGPYTWSGQFDVWVRFDSDELDTTLHALHVATSPVELVEQFAKR